jgi:hypothetical protein
VLASLRRNLHNLIREIADPTDGRGPDLPTREELRLPELEVLTELDQPLCWFPVPSMYGGFRARGGRDRTRGRGAMAEAIGGAADEVLTVVCKAERQLRAHLRRVADGVDG